MDPGPVSAKDDLGTKYMVDRMKGMYALEWASGKGNANAANAVAWSCGLALTKEPQVSAGRFGRWPDTSDQIEPHATPGCSQPMDE